MTKRIYTRAFATARFTAPDLDPLIVTQSLLLPPDSQCRRGEPRLIRVKSGDVEQRSPCRAGVWAMSSERWVISPRLHIHLAWLLDELEPKRDAIAKILGDGVRAGFFCFSSGATPELPALPRAVRKRADALGFVIDIDHYDTSGDPGGG